MKILLSSAGRQSFLVREFQKALNNGGEVVVTDYDEEALSFEAADKSFVAPSYNDESYVTWMIELCKKEHVSLLISLNVDELLVLEENRRYFEEINCFVVGGDLDSIKSTYDKYLLYKLCKRLGIETPETYLLEEIKHIKNINYPIIAKPSKGKGSRGNFIYKDEKQLKEALARNEVLFTTDTYVFQELIEGDEYGVDLINNLKGQFETAFVRKKYKMKNGETHEAISISNKDWLNLAKKISNELKHQGIIDMDFMVLNDKKYLIDINHRFGGGYIFSHVAGAELPKAIVNWFHKREVNPVWLMPKENVHSKREGLEVNII